MNLNIDTKTLEACLKTVGNIGSTTYVNICNGQSNVVNWGTGDWIGSILLFSLLVLIVFGLPALFIWMMKS